MMTLSRGCSEDKPSWKRRRLHGTDQQNVQYSQFFRLSWRVWLRDDEKERTEDRVDVMPIQMVIDGGPSTLEQQQADGLRRIVDASHVTANWTIDLKPLIDIEGNGRMRAGTDEFGFCQLESLSKINGAQEWGGGLAVRLGFAVTEY